PRPRLPQNRNPKSTMATRLSHTQYIAILGEGAAAADPALLGGKGASLCRLVNLGYRVPPGFVITRDAFQSALKEMGLASALDTLDLLLACSGETISTSELIRQSIFSRQIPARIFEPIMQMVENL